MKKRIIHEIILAAAVVLSVAPDPAALAAVIVGPVMTGIAGGTLTGNVIYLERVAMAPDAVITVELQDASAGIVAVIATQDINAEGRQVPIPFELPYDPARIDPAGTYLLSARIAENGQTTFASQTGVPVLTNKLLRHNVELNRWTELADMPGPGLSNTTAVRLGSKVYIPGGFDGNMTDYANTHLVYDIATDFWTQAAPIPSGLLPGSTMFAWSAAVAAPGETSYYLTGGTTSISAFIATGDVLTDTYRFTPSTNQWEASRSMTTPRFAHTAAWVATANRGLCVVGGLSNGTNDAGQPILVLLTRGECYDPASGTGWQQTGELNFPRYNAGSAIGPDGRWYVFGGVDAAGLGVPETEVYDAVSNNWLLLGSSYVLGGLPTDPGIEWPRGAFWLENLYIYGGNTPREQRVVSSVDRLTLGANFLNTSGRTFVPITTKIGSDNVLFWATYLPHNLPTSGNFMRSDQFYNPYSFDWPVFGRAIVRLRNIPENTNYNIAVYDGNKRLYGEGNTAVTGNKEVSVTLLPGRYYVVVQRIFPKDLPNPHVPVSYTHLTLPTKRIV